jgi:hypothetical protein
MLSTRIPPLYILSRHALTNTRPEASLPGRLYFPICHTFPRAHSSTEAVPQLLIRQDKNKNKRKSITKTKTKFPEEGRRAGTDLPILPRLSRRSPARHLRLLPLPLAMRLGSVCPSHLLPASPDHSEGSDDVLLEPLQVPDRIERGRRTTGDHHDLRDDASGPGPYGLGTRRPSCHCTRATRPGIGPDLLRRRTPPHIQTAGLVVGVRHVDDAASSAFPRRLATGAWGLPCLN